MSTFNRKLFDFFGGLFREDDPTVQKAIVTVSGVPLPSPTKSSDMQSGSLSNELQWMKAYQDMMTAFWNINVAEGEFLDTLGSDWLGLGRYPGESDSLYSTRIKAYLTANRNTPWGLEQIMRLFSPNFVLIQEGISGFGAVTRSFLGRYVDVSAGYDRTRPVVATTNVTGRTANQFTVDSETGFAVNDEAWFNDGSTIKCYVVTAIAAGSVTVSTKGYSSKYPFAATFAPGASAVFTVVAHGLLTGDVVGIINGGEIPDGSYAVTKLTDDTFSIPHVAAASGTATVKWGFATGILTFGGTTGTLTKYQNAIISKTYIGSISSGLLKIRITIESNALTNNPIVAKFIFDMATNSKIPGSRVEVRKV